MGRRKQVPVGLFERCQFFGELRGPSNGSRSKGYSAKEIQKRYPTHNLKVSTINQYAAIWHNSHDDVLEAIRKEELIFSKARLLSKLSKPKQLDFLSVATSRMIDVKELNRKIIDQSSDYRAMADRYADDGFIGKLTKPELQVQEFISLKLGAEIKFGRGKSKKLEWRITYYGLDSALELVDKLELVSDERQDYLVDIISRGFSKINGVDVQNGHIVVRFVQHSHFLDLLDKLASKWDFS